MQVKLSLMVLLLAVIISQAVFASGLLLFGRKNRLPNTLLAIFILAITLWLCDNFLRIGLIYRQNPNLYFMPIFYSFGFGPLIYFYVKSLTHRNFKFNKKHLLHFIPVALQAGLYFFLTLKPYAFKQWFWENIHAVYTYRIEFDGTWISLTIYLLLSFKLIKNYQKWVVNHYSEVSKIRLNWLMILVGVLLVLCIQWPIEIILRDVFNLYFQYDYSILILGFMALVMGIGGLRQANLPEVTYVNVAQETDKSVTMFAIDPTILAKIKAAMEVEKLYLHPTLNLFEFSKTLSLNPKTVSRHINEGLNKSFNDFVNDYRVEEVQRRLKTSDVKKMTILAIAYESGFNSKTSFHRVFKENTGAAPSANLY